MNCAWDAFISLLPQDMRHEVNKQGAKSLQELRLRLGQPVEMVLNGKSTWLSRKARSEDLSFVVNSASRYSPWSASTAAQGYITATGGHRVGICGVCVIQNGIMTGISKATSLCIRVAKDFPGIGNGCDLSGSVLILGPPGSGKTTLLRDLIRRRADAAWGSVAVVDERGELFPVGADFYKGCRTDVLTGCGKAHGIETALRTMGPTVIAVDEITAKSDCDALMHAAWCGVDLMATAHAAGIQDLLQRPIYRPLAESSLFQTVLILNRDKSWRRERVRL